MNRNMLLLAAVAAFLLWVLIGLALMAVVIAG